jgi:hypothetical protein
MKRGGLWKSIFCFFVIVPVMWGTIVLAAELRVPSQYSSIQAAIDAAAPGVDVVLVEDGTYSGNLLVEKAITIKSENGAEHCVIDCAGSGVGVTFRGPGANGAVLSGFKITGGNAAWGGAIACFQASPIISDCVMENNVASYGGGLFVKNVSASDPSPTLIGCTIANNTATKRGGGVFLHTYASPSFYNCLIAGNSASEYGGAFYCYFKCAPDIIHCTVSDNTSGLSGSGISCFLCSDPDFPYFPVVTNSIIWGNVATSGAEIYLSNSLLDITFSAFDPGVENSNIQIIGTSSVSEEGNIYENPAFVGEGDYHLSPVSPCIDAGTDQIELPEFDFEGHPRVVGNAPDMGADEFYVPKATVVQVEIDIKPGCAENKINLKSWGVLLVAVKTTNDFDALAIDPSTVMFAGASPVWWIFYDIDRDRDKDMLFFFRVQKLVELNEESTQATLTGMTKDGMPFEGTDKVTIIKPKGKAKGWRFGRK